MDEIKYFGMISEITDINVKGFPSKFPMFFLATQEEMFDYDKLMLKSIASGFDPKIRKLCFTLGCTEGYNHEIIRQMIKDLPEIPEEKYILLKNIVHWNPVLEATRVLENYIALAEAAQESPTAELIKEYMHEAGVEAKLKNDAFINAK